MFHDFYKMREQPFGVTPDPRFLYLGQSHREALASLYYGIEANRGFVALIAPPGFGKTTLTFQLLEHLHEDIRTVFLFQTQCNSQELFQYILNELGVDAAGMDMVSMQNKFKQILSRELLAGRRFLLIIDEAQNLDPEVLETIRLLSNFETSREKLLQILLIGQPQLASKLADPALQQMQQRIAMFARLQPFGADDTVRYIAHRLAIAGYDGSPLFTHGALRIITEQSQGIPRKINSLCFSALSLACAMGGKQVDAIMMEEVIADLDVDSLHRPQVTPPATPLPVTARPALSSYSATPQSRFASRFVGIATVAAAIIFGIAALPYFSQGRSDRFLQASKQAWMSIRGASASTGSPAVVKTMPKLVSSVQNEQAPDIPTALPEQATPSNPEAETKTATVQPGETLRHLMLRTIGVYNDGTMEQIRKLNPGITDPNHVEIGEAIRYLPASGNPDSQNASETINMAGRN